MGDDGVWEGLGENIVAVSEEDTGEGYGMDKAGLSGVN